MKAKLRIISRRLVLLIFLLLATIVLSPPAAVFFHQPRATAHWEVASPAQFHLGEVIEASLVIITLPGVSIDTSRLPDVGEVIKLPSKLLELSPEDSMLAYDIPPTVSEGELEVVSRQITRYSQGGLVVTKVGYELIYLLEIDPTAPADDKRLPIFMTFFQEYWDWRDGKLRRIARPMSVDTTDLLIVPRVDESSEPIFRFTQFALSGSPWPYLRLAGFASLGLAICLIVRRALAIIPKRRPGRVQTEDSPPAAQKLFELWCEKPEPMAFIEAIKLYRAGVWGRPQATLWVVTTFVLYSGVALDLDQAKSIFARLVKEVSDA